MKTLMTGVSGVRGIVGATLTPDVISRLALAFAKLIGGGKIAVGRDTRITGEMVSNIVNGSLIASGCEVLELGIVPTPTVQYAVRKLKLNGGIVISASHNPIEWNALKLYKKGGILLTEKESKKLYSNLENFDLVDYRQIKPVKNFDAADLHIESVLKAIKNINTIKKRRFKVAIDSCNGAGSKITLKLLKMLNCKIFPIYTDPDGFFPRVAEPLPENLTKLCSLVKKHRCDIGFAQDPDADRLAIVDNTGKPLGEEYTLAIAVNYILNFEKGTVVTNLSTSRIIDDVCRAHNVKCVRTKVGEANVVEKMLQVKSPIGGEGNGGVVYPKVNYGRDSLTGIGIVLDWLSTSDKKLNILMNSFKKYYILKKKFDCDRARISKIVDHIKAKYRINIKSAIDGIKLEWPDYWVHIRPSNTEPVIRITAEADNKKILPSIINEFKKFLN